MIGRTLFDRGRRVSRGRTVLLLPPTTRSAPGMSSALRRRCMAGQSIPASRTLAIEQIAVHDALNAIDPGIGAMCSTGARQPGRRSMRPSRLPPMTRWSARLRPG